MFGLQGVAGASQWILDSGATSSCTSDLTVFTSLSRKVPFNRIKVANGAYASVTGVGTVKLHVVDPSTATTVCITLKEVLLIPDCPVNLISVRALWNHSRISSTFTDVCRLDLPNGISIKFSAKDENHYYCQAMAKQSTSHSKTTDSVQPDGHNATGESGIHATATAVSADVIHARLGHASPERVEHTLRRSVGLPASPFYKKEISHRHCEFCRTGGAKRHPFHPVPDEHQPKRFGDRIHSDLCGEFPASFNGGFKYILSFVDSFTGYAEIYFLQTKHSDEIKTHFEHFQRRWKDKLPGGVVREWFTDNGGEFTSNDLDQFMHEFGVRRGFTVPYCSPQNAQAERLWGILQRCMRISLAHSGLPINFWTYAAKHANDLHNLLPRSSNPDKMSPHEALHGTKPDFSYVRVWGCLAYCTLRNEADRESRVSPTGVKAVHLGRDESRKGWRVFMPSLNRITTSRDITFDEQRFLRFDNQGVVVDDTERFVDDDGPDMDPIRIYNDTLQRARWRGEPRTRADLPLQQQQQPEQRQQGSGDANEEPGWAHPDADQSHFSTSQCSNPRCSIRSVDGRHDGPCSFERIGSSDGLPSSRTRSGAQRAAFVDPFSVYFAVPKTITSDETEDHTNDRWSISTERFGEIPIPNTYDEAMGSKFADKWREAMDREIRELLGRKTWESSRIPMGRKATRSRWVYTIKYKSDGTIERFKARFVVCGYSQIHGVDYEQSFSSTMRATTFRTLLSLAAQAGFQAEHIDISNAFCQADIDGVDIWVQPPRGFETLCEGGQGLKLLKALYGTKQASFLWQQTLAKWLVSQGFVRLKTDPCVYIKTVNGVRLIVGCYVDDLVVLHDEKTKMFAHFRSSFLQSYGGRFDGKHLGRLEWFLGVKVDQRANGDIHIDQSKYINDLVNKFIPNHDAIAFGRKIPYPASKFKELQEASSDAEIERLKKLPYLQLVGALLYLSTMSRPDIAYHMSVLCSFMQNPSLQCFEAAQSVLLYVAHTKNLTIRYSRTFAVPECFTPYSDNTIRENHGLHAFSDSTWTAPRSICGYTVFRSGGPIAWSARKLHVIADSTALAEYSAASATSKELSFVRNMLFELGAMVHGPIALAVDNKAAIKISEERGVSKLTKHFDFAAHRIRDEVEHLRLRCYFVDTDSQLADIFTKALGDWVFMRLRDKFFG